MGNFYRVSVENEDGATVLELMAPAEMLRQFAPSAVAAALGATIKDDVPGGVYGEPVRHEQAGEQKERRRRRTRAEMEAARAKTSDEIRRSEGAERAEQYDNQTPAPVAESEAPAYSPFGPK